MCKYVYSLLITHKYLLSLFIINNFDYTSEYFTIGTMFQNGQLYGSFYKSNIKLQSEKLSLTNINIKVVDKHFITFISYTLSCRIEVLLPTLTRWRLK